MLELFGGVGRRAWEGLGRAGARGRVRSVILITGREVVGRGRREDLMAVWGSTERYWRIDDEVIWKREGEGWRRVEQIMDLL